MSTDDLEERPRYDIKSHRSLEQPTNWQTATQKHERSTDQILKNGTEYFHSPFKRSIVTKLFISGLSRDWKSPSLDTTATGYPAQDETRIARKIKENKARNWERAVRGQCQAKRLEDGIHQTAHPERKYNEVSVVVRN